MWISHADVANLLRRRELKRLVRCQVIRPHWVDENWVVIIAVYDERQQLRPIRCSLSAREHGWRAVRGGVATRI